MTIHELKIDISPEIYCYLLFFCQFFYREKHIASYLCDELVAPTPYTLFNNKSLFRLHLAVIDLQAYQNVINLTDHC